MLLAALCLYSSAEYQNWALFWLAIMEKHKWDQPSGKNSDKPVSPLFREHCVWWPAKLPQACLGENRGFWKPSSLHSQPRSYSGAAARAQREKSVSGSVWGLCKTIEFQLKGLCRVHTSLPPPIPTSSALWTASPSWMNLLGWGIQE